MRKDEKTLEILEELYADYNRREYVSPDPLEFLYLYDSPTDREVVGLIASSLAYGRVASILASIRKVLSVLGESPADCLASCGAEYLESALSGFVHRFTAGEEMAHFLHGIGQALNEHGSLERLFLSAMTEQAGVSGAMEGFASAVLKYSGLEQSHLLPLPSKGSACKRLCLYIRWMVRCDTVDPGGWSGISQSNIMIPLDTHMYRIACGLGFVTRGTPDGKAVMQATDGFRRLRPDDPVRYDFALTRFGIRTGMSVEELLDKFE